jgi:phosphatidate cytidylyltransferase
VALIDEFHRAQEIAQERAKETQELFREAQEQALELARAHAHEARERMRLAAETMPPGLLVRLLSSFVGIPFSLAVSFADIGSAVRGVPFASAIILSALLGGWEFFRGVRLRGFRPTWILGIIAIGMMQVAAWAISVNLYPSVLPAVFATLVILTLIYQIFRRDPEPVANLGVTFVGVVYVGWLMSYLIFLRMIPGSVHVWPFQNAVIPYFDMTSLGAWLVLYCCAVTWSTDSGAYFVGLRWGKTPLAPHISPKKTTEGAIGGVIAATTMSILWGTWIGIPLIHTIFLGALIGALGQMGDLAESAMKRDLGIKDFGAVMPGHGGILDRFDSLLFTAPMAYYYLVLALPR